MARVLVTPRSLTRDGHPALEALAAAEHEVVFSTPGVQPDEAELLARLPGCAAHLAGVETVGARVLEAAAGTLKVISRNGTGVDNIDLAAAARLGIAVCRAAGANARGVAELTLGLVLALARFLPAGDRAIKAGAWERRKGIELEGRTLGVVGCGAIGKRVATFALALGMDVLAHDVVPDASFAPSERFRFVPLEALLAGADVVSLHCPSTPDGAPLLDAGRVARMRPGALLVNTSRADLVDRDALLAALDEGRVAGAGLDVFAAEPPGDDPLARHARVVATPHVGGYTAESVSRAVGVAVENILAHIGRGGE